MYIGKTIKPLTMRLVGHLHEVFYRKRVQFPQKSNWIKSLLDTGKYPIIELIEETDDILADSRERYWVDFYKDKFTLFNVMFNSNNCSIREDLRKKVYQYNKDGLFLKEWESILSVEKELKIPAGNIIKGCKGERKSGGDFMWRYYKVESINKYTKDSFKKPVYQYDYLGHLIAEYECAREAIGFNYKNISQCCVGDKMSHKGFQWSFDKAERFNEYKKKNNHKK